MQFPPPKELTFLAYMTGSISKEEYFELLKKWNEEYEEKKKEAIDHDNV